MQAAAVAMLVVAAGATLQSARNSQAAANTEAQSYKEQRTTAKIAAQDQEAQRRTELNRILSLQTAQASKYNLDLNRSGSFAALQQDSIENANRDVLNIRLQGRQQYAYYSAARSNARLAANSAIWDGMAKVAGLGAGGFGMGNAGGPSGGSVVQGASYGTGPGRL